MRQGEAITKSAITIAPMRLSWRQRLVCWSEAALSDTTMRFEYRSVSSHDASMEGLAGLTIGVTGGSHEL